MDCRFGDLEFRIPVTAPVLFEEIAKAEEEPQAPSPKAKAKGRASKAEDTLYISLYSLRS